MIGVGNIPFAGIEKSVGPSPTRKHVIKDSRVGRVAGIEKFDV